MDYPRLKGESHLELNDCVSIQGPSARFYDLLGLQIFTSLSETGTAGIHDSCRRSFVFCFGSYGDEGKKEET